MAKTPIRVYVKVDDSGKLVERKVCREELGDDWILLTRETNEMTMARPSSYRYNKDGTAEGLPECKMIVSTTSFLANGDEDFSVSIRGDSVPDGDLVEVAINGDSYMIEKNDHIEIATDTPGVFVVRMTDPRYYCVESEVVVYAIS